MSCCNDYNNSNNNKSNDRNKLPSDPDYEFKSFPMNMEDLDNVVGFGTHGSSHLEGVTKWYLYASSKLNVVSPGDGIVSKVESNGEKESIITIDFSAEVRVRFDHVIKDDSITEGIRVTVGQIIATSNPPTAVDFNVYNTTVNNGFPVSWPMDYNTAVCPLNHLSQELKTAFLSKWDSTWLPGLFPSETCEPFYCTALNINTENDVRGVWFTHQAENSMHGVCISFSDCDSSYSCGQNLRIRMKYKDESYSGGDGYVVSETSVGSGIKRMKLNQCGSGFFSNKYLLYQFQTGNQIKIEISDSEKNTFSGQARIYDREWESLWE